MRYRAKTKIARYGGEKESPLSELDQFLSLPYTPLGSLFTGYSSIKRKRESPPGTRASAMSCRKKRLIKITMH